MGTSCMNPYLKCFCRFGQVTSKVPPIRYNVKQRNRPDCNPSDPHPCVDKHIAKNPCFVSPTYHKKDEKPKAQPFVSMWENPECCIRTLCPKVQRFDACYWRPSDKSCRKYQQTWAECPDLRILPKKVCCFEKIQMPPVPRRCLERPKTACPKDTKAFCVKVESLKCPKMVWPGCCPVRNPPKCLIMKHPSHCKKTCCPYPAFSECRRSRGKRGKIVECGCTNPVAMCDVMAYLRYKQIYGLRYPY